MNDARPDSFATTSARPMARGGWVCICGPSGAGKDSLIAWVAQATHGRPDIVCSRRWITRPAHPGSDHEVLDDAGYEARLAAGEMAWHWHAHGVRYGLPARYRDAVRAGALVLVNGSRAHLATLRDPDPVWVVEVTAAPAVLRSRLHARGRENEASMQRRQARNGEHRVTAAHVTIVNDGSLATAGERLLAFLDRVRSGHQPKT